MKLTNYLTALVVFALASRFSFNADKEALMIGTEKESYKNHILTALKKARNMPPQQRAEYLESLKDVLNSMQTASMTNEQENRRNRFAGYHKGL